MKAAEVAARRGHDVVLLERRAELGGQLRLAAKVKGRGEIGQVITHLEGQLRKLGVDVRLGQAAAAESVLALEPQGVIVATGSAPRRELLGNIARGLLDTPGLERDDVHDVWQVLEQDAPLGERVLVVDDGEGGWKGISIALELSEAGKEVHLSTPLPYVGAKIGPFSQNKLIPRIFASGIVTHPFASLRSVSDDGARLAESGGETTVAVDDVILAGWHHPVDDLYFGLKDAGIPLERVGDAIACRSMMEAVHEGERAARRI
jgi:NADPH-dependent 2,4-dienoyl-CoA reductase/sulfur reductase-like enzyme